MVKNDTQSLPLDNLVQELRRGSITLAVLALLKEEQYGYSVIKQLAECDLEVDQGTLYPLLRRLEAQGLLESRWRVEEGRPRRYYQISAQGQQVLEALKDEWRKMVASLAPLLE